MEGPRKQERRYRVVRNNGMAFDEWDDLTLEEARTSAAQLNETESPHGPYRVQRAVWIDA